MALQLQLNLGGLLELHSNVNQIITGCVINVLSGGTCDGDPEALKNEKTDQSCVAYADGKVLPEQASQLALSGAACGIVKGFTLDRWAMQQFGYDWNDLYTKNPPEGANLYPADKLQGSPDDYCVNLKSPTSANQMKIIQILIQFQFVILL